MSFMLMAPTILTSPKVDERMKKVAQAEVAAETAAKSVADPVKSAEAAQAAKQAVLKQIEAEESESDEEEEKGVLQTVKDAIVALDDAVTSGLSKIDAKIGFSAAVNKVDDKLKIGDKALAVAKAADENLIRPVVYGVTRAAGVFKRKLVKKKVVVKKKSVIGKVGTPSSSSSASASTPASDLKSPEFFTVGDDDLENGQEMKEMTSDHDHDVNSIPEDEEESEYEEVEVEEEVEVLEEVSDDEASTSTPQKTSVASPRATTSAPNTSRSPTSAPNSSRSQIPSQPHGASISSPPSSTSSIRASATSSPRHAAPPAQHSQPKAQSQRRKSSDNSSEA